MIAVCHAHPPRATAFACARRALPAAILPEAVLLLGGEVPLAPYATPGTAEVAASIRPFIEHHQALLLSNHGVVAVGGHTGRSLPAARGGGTGGGGGVGGGEAGRSRPPDPAVRRYGHEIVPGAIVAAHDACGRERCTRAEARPRGLASGRDNFAVRN